MLLVGTRKGAFLLHGDAPRRQWRLHGPHLLGCVVNHVVLDPRDGRTVLMAARTGHLGPTVYRSTDRGRQDRIRPHIRLFVGGEPASTLAHPIGAGEDVHIIAALSGG